VCSDRSSTFFRCRGAGTIHLVQEKKQSFTTNENSCSWDRSIETLKNEIQVRHYSKKTLKAYSLWVEKLRYFAKDKKPETITVEDVKAFLTFLAVKKKGPLLTRTRHLMLCCSSSAMC